MAEYPFLKLYTDAYLGDTPVPNPRTWAHHGIYMLALMFAWRTPGCRLPDDPDWLAQRFGCSVRELEREVMPVIRLYFKKRGKGWSQKRLTKERSRAKTASETASRNAKSRWANEKGVCEADARSEPQAGGHSARTGSAQGRTAHQSPESRTTTRTRKTPPLSSPAV